MQKRAIKLLAFLAMAIGASEANAAIYKVDIDNVNNVTVDINGTEVTGLQNGLNEIDMNGERYLTVTAKEGVMFSEVTLVDSYDNSEYDILYQVYPNANGLFYIDLSSSFPEDESFRIRTASAAEARTATFTVTIDDPSKAKITRKDVEIELTAGENAIKFDPATESKIEIVPTGKPFYSITHNGTAITSDYRYELTVSDGDKVDIVTAYPDVDYSVKFILTGTGSEDFITEVDVDGKPEFNWKAANFTVKAGSELSLKGNTNEFEVMSFTINGHSAMFANPTKILITEDAEIAIEVRKYASFEMTINVDDPSRVKVYRGHSYNGDLLELKAGDNTVEITRNTPIVSLVPVDGFYINTLEVNSSAYDVEELQRSPVRVGSLSDGSVMKVTTGVIVRDKKAMVYVYNLEPAADFFKLMRADQSAIEITEGYNPIEYYDRDNAFRFETGGPVEAKVYQNDKLAEPLPGGFNYDLVLAQGDVVKVFFDFTPVFHNVSFAVEPEGSEMVKVIRDHMTESGAADFKAATHTHVCLTPTQPEARIEVKVNGETLEADADGNFTFTVDSDKAVSITGTESGIAEIGVGAASGPVYDLQGRKLAAPAKGINIINGKKVLVK